MEGFQFFDILLLAMVAGFIAFKLYSVLGRRTGHERSREERVPASGTQTSRKTAKETDNVIPMPEPASSASAEGQPLVSAAVNRALMDIKLADRRFDVAPFLRGARGAYEMVVTAFAEGDHDTLRSLVSDEVFQTFDGAMRTREERHERVDFSFQGIKSARITGAELKGRSAEITVTFDAEFILAVYDPHGALVEGDPKQPHSVTEVWTFARETNSSDPNWTLVATQGGG